MKVLLKLPFIVLTTAIAFSASATDNPPVSIKYSISFGRCSGYCSREIEISEDRVAFHATGRNQAGGIAPISQTDKVENREWREILQLIDKEKLSALPDRIGCPDCADSGAERIEVTFRSAETKRVIFDHDNPPEEISELVKALKKIHSRFKVPDISTFETAPQSCILGCKSHNLGA